MHLGHRNVINFDNRPFADRDEMDYVMINLWNSRVQKDDNIYILGDFCYKSGKTADWYKGRHGSWHIYGHIHGDRGDVYQFMKTREHALNAEACIKIIRRH